MTLTKYSDYVSSGVSWIDQFPSHWKRTALKHVVVTPITDGPHTTPEFVDEGIPFVSAESVWDGRVHLESRRGNISTEDHRFFSQKYSPQKHDVYVVKSGSTTGKVAINDLETEFNIWSPLAAIRCDRQIAEPRFVYHALNSDYFQRLVQVSWSFGTQPNIGMSVLENLEIVVPTVDEQVAIADFLDEATGKIDKLVCKKRELIELLEEKRRALITRCVTRGLPPEAARAAGLNPNPKLKPSGIDWLGEIPEHWSVKKGRYLGVLKGSVSPTDEEYSDDEGVRFAKVDDLNYVGPDFRLHATKARIVGYPARKRTAIIFPKRGAAIFTNKVVVADGEFHFDTNLMGWEIFERFNVRYVAYALTSRRLDDLADVSTVPQINNKHIYPASFACPLERHEQDLIAEFLDEKAILFEALIGRTRDAIDRLLEYRSALITSAVTGKIDVREVKP